MTTYAQITAWQLWSRHRWGWILICTWLIGTALTWQMIDEPARLIAVVPLAVLPFAFFFLYLLVVLGHSLDEDISGCRSCFPSRLFLLPIPTHQLVLWPLLYGALITAVLWTLFQLLLLRPARIHVSWWWGPLQLMTVLAWFQAILWTRSRLPQLRVILLFVVLMISGAIHVAYRELELSRTGIAWFLMGMLLLAWLTAWRGVVRARSDPGFETWDWTQMWDVVRNAFGRTTMPFRSNTQAQHWLDRKLLGGLSGPLGGCVMILMTLPVMNKVKTILAQAITAGALPNLSNVRPEVTALVHIVGVLLYIPICAVGTFPIRSSYPSSQSLRAMSLFYATRPLSNVEMVIRKHQTAWRTTIVSCALGVSVLLFAIWISGNLPLLGELRQHRWASWQTWEVILFLSGLFCGLILLTWTVMITGFCISFTGREWVVILALLTLGAVVIAICFLIYWLTFVRPDLSATLMHALPWLLIVMLTVKLFLTWRTMSELFRRGWISKQRLTRGLLSWGVTMLTLATFLRWCLPSNVVLWSDALLIASVLLPWNRVWAAPLLLAWNRHR